MALSPLALSMLLAASVLSAPSAHAQVPTTAAPPASPAPSAPSAAVAAVIADAQAQVKAGQFAEAVAALTAAKTDSVPPGDKQALDFAIADAHAAWGFNLFQAARYDEMADHLNASLALDQQYPQRLAQKANDLRRIGMVQDIQGQHKKAIGFYEQALTIYRQVNDQNGEAKALNNLGIAYINLSQYEKAIGFYEQALPVFQRIEARNDEANALMNLGVAYINLSQYKKAIGLYEQALSIYQQVKDRNGEAKALTNLGAAYDGLSQYEKAIRFYEQALPIYRQATDRNVAAMALMNMGGAYDSLSQYEKAVDNFQQALLIYRQIKDRDGEAKALTDLGIAYGSLSQYEKVIGYFQQALPFFQQVKDRNGEAGALANLGVAYYSLDQYAKAIGFYDQALPIYQQIKDRDGEANALTNLGNAYKSLGQYEKAISLYEQALPIYRQVEDRNGEASALTDLGSAYDSLGQRAKAVGLYEQALPIFQQVKDRDGEANALSGLASAWSNAQNPNRNPGLAIFFGKQAINILQSIRADIHGMDKQTQQGFAKNRGRSYRDLADLLISQDRLDEALQVLDLFKQEEYLNFNKPAPGKSNIETSLAGTANLTPREQRCFAALETAGGVLRRDAAKLGQLQNAKQPTQALAPAQQHRHAAAAAKEAADESNYQKTLSSLSSAFPKKPDPMLDRLASTSNARGLQAALRKLGDGSVAVYTLVTDKNLDLLLVTPRRLVARTAPLASATDLDRKIAAFRAVLQDPYSDPRPLGKTLYDKLIGPIKADLDRAHAQTLLVSLDGNLRYIPLAALSPDGKKHYLVETYRTALYTPAAIANLTRSPNPNWTALAMGVSQPHEGFKDLKAVPGELRAVARTGGESGPDAGLFPGRRLLDAAFTKDGMLSALRMGYPLVHVASHFKFTGDETTSFLLLGDGTHLTLADMKTLPDSVFAGVNLLTLSACETATGNLGAAAGANGSRDVENVAVLAQRKGADAVLASLWSVNDASTGILMRTFYHARQSGSASRGGENKAEGLRQAQLALLTGGVKSGAAVKHSAKRSVLGGSASPSVSAADAPAFVPNPKAPFAHPFYWAPFILIGNGK